MHSATPGMSSAQAPGHCARAGRGARGGPLRAPWSMYCALQGRRPQAFPLVFRWSLAGLYPASAGSPRHARSGLPFPDPSMAAAPHSRAVRPAVDRLRRPRHGDQRPPNSPERREQTHRRHPMGRGVRCRASEPCPHLVARRRGSRGTCASAPRPGGGPSPCRARASLSARHGRPPDVLYRSV